MAQTALKFPFGKHTKGKPDILRTSDWRRERAELERSLGHTSIELHQTYQHFNTTCDQDLIESYIFQINALHARYNYLLRRLKEGELC